MRVPRSCIASLAVGCAFCAYAINAVAQNYPNRVVRYLVPDSSGGGIDIIARIVAGGLSEVFHQQMIVDNRPGAASIIATEIAKNAPADGYTILHMSSNLAANVSLYKSLPYDLVNDFAPVTQISWSPAAAVVHPSLPVKSIGDLIHLAKARPGAINFASAGAGSRSFVDAVLFSDMAGVKMVHVAYKGGGPAIIAMVSGEMQLMFAPVQTALPHIRSGRLRALGVTTASRVPLLAEVPTVAEGGVTGYASPHWFGLMVPVKTSREVVAAIHRATIAALKRPEVVKRLNDVGNIPVGNTPEEFGALIKSEIALLGDIFRKAGVSAN